MATHGLTQVGAALSADRWRPATHRTNTTSGVRRGKVAGGELRLDAVARRPAQSRSSASRKRRAHLRAIRGNRMSVSVPGRQRDIGLPGCAGKIPLALEG